MHEGQTYYLGGSDRGSVYEVQLKASRRQGVAMATTGEGEGAESASLREGEDDYDDDEGDRAALEMEHRRLLKMDYDVFLETMEKR